MRLTGSVLRTRWYSTGTKKLTASFEERNDLLKAVNRELQYPLLRPRRPDLPVARVSELVTQFQTLEHVSVPETPEFEIRGRISGLRQASKGLMFVDLEEGGKQIQVVMNAKKIPIPLSDREVLMHSLLRRGDAISAVGRPWRTKAGELSLLSSTNITLLAPSLHPLPDSSASKVIRKHNRVVELKAFKEARRVLEVREAVVRHISGFLRESGFLQVNTPHLSSNVGGAAAKYFQTQADGGADLYLRVAPELWLKRLIIGGFDRVFEIGNSYRNEGIDATHNPEFTTCEFYMTFATLDDLISLTQRLLKHVASKVSNEFPEFTENCAVLRQEYQVVDFVPELEKAIGGRKLELDAEFLRALCSEFSIPTKTDDDVPKYLDRLCGHFLESQCSAPTFIVNHPSVMAPLAKETIVDGVSVSRRFELLIDQREYINAYEEENDPVNQFSKLKQQNPAVPDRKYVDAMEWGLPPTGGWGLGVDRLVMLITGSERISDTLSFGDLTQVQRL